MTGTFAVLNPATEAVLAEQPLADAGEVDAAVSRARAAFPGWRDVAPTDRARLLRRLADSVADHAEELAQLETANVGKPIASSRGEVGAVADVFHYYAGCVDKHVGETIPVARGIAMTFHEPLGVVGLITPWNFPLLIASWKLGPALACGNTVVLKPSELTPLTALRLGELALEAGLPEGVLNVVVGTGAEAGWRLVEHPDVRKIGFTGSTAVGRRIMAGCAEQVKRVTLELGGKSASIVFADADLEAAAAAAPYAVFDNSGQDCCARSRVLVERPVFERFVELLIGETSQIAVGDPLADGTVMGPLVSAAHRDKVVGYVEEVEVAYSGDAPTGPGFWFPCTVVAPADPGARAVPRGDLRAGRGGRAVRRRDRRGDHRQRLRVRALRLDLDPRRGACPAGGPSPRVRHAVRELELLGPGQHAVRWLQAERARSGAVDARAGRVQRAEDGLRVDGPLSARSARQGLLGLVAGGARRGEDPVGVLAVADLHHDLDAGLAHVEVDPLSHVLDLDDVRSLRADHVEQAGEPAGAIRDPDEQEEPPSRRASPLVG